jgi:hypothetical protein
MTHLEALCLREAHVPLSVCEGQLELLSHGHRYAFYRCACGASLLLRNGVLTRVIGRPAAAAVDELAKSFELKSRSVS